MNEQMPESGPPDPQPGAPRPPDPAPAFSSGRGLYWLSESIALLRRQPFRLLVLGLVLQLLGGFSQAGILGVVFVILAPALAAGMLQGLHLAAAGQRPPVLVLFSAFSQPARLPGLMLLGLLTVLLAVLTVAVVLGGSLGALDPDLVARLEAGDPAAISEIDPQILLRVVMGLVFGVLLGASLGFYAVPLMWFHAMPLGRALWTGLWMMLRQWRALLVLGLMVALLGLPVVTAVGMVVSAQAMSGSPSTLLTLFMLILLVAYQLLAFATQYVSFRDVFSGPEQQPPPAAGDQLVA